MMYYVFWKTQCDRRLVHPFAQGIQRGTKAPSMAIYKLPQKKKLSEIIIVCVMDANGPKFIIREGKILKEAN